ncbi:GNAT family N-acetyltransferase [Pontibacter rugosus]
MYIKEIKAEDTWKLRRKVMWPDKEIRYVQLPDDQKGTHFGLYLNNELVAVISLFIEGRRGQFRKFATLPASQGKGYGSLLLRHLIAQAAAKGVEVIWCNARQEKSTFYNRFGLKETNQRFARGGKTMWLWKAL